MICKLKDSYSVAYASCSERSKTTWFSTSGEDELRAFVASSGFIPGEWSANGTVAAVRYYRQDLTWCAEVSFDDDISGSLTNLTESRPAQHELDSINIPLDIRKSPNYRTKWTHYLFGSSEDSKAPALPGAWATAKTEANIESTGVVYIWVKDPASVPKTWETVTFTVNNKKVDKKIHYLLVAEPTEFGLEKIDYYTYQITESAEFGKEEDAGFVCSYYLNCIRARPILGNMGVKRKGDWKCDHASLRHNGKKWEAKLVWTQSGDENGWNAEMYKTIRSSKK